MNSWIIPAATANRGWSLLVGGLGSKPLVGNSGGKASGWGTRGQDLMLRKSGGGGGGGAGGLLGGKASWFSISINK